MTNDVIVRCVLCTTWRQIPGDNIGKRLRCERCGATFSAGTKASGPERLAVMPALRLTPTPTDDAIPTHEARARPVTLPPARTMSGGPAPERSRRPRPQPTSPYS